VVSNNIERDELQMLQTLVIQSVESQGWSFTWQMFKRSWGRRRRQPIIRSEASAGIGLDGSDICAVRATSERLAREMSQKRRAYPFWPRLQNWKGLSLSGVSKGCTQAPRLPLEEPGRPRLAKSPVPRTWLSVHTVRYGCVFDNAYAKTYSSELLMKWCRLQWIKHLRWSEIYYF